MGGPGNAEVGRNKRWAVPPIRAVSNLASTLRQVLLRLVLFRRQIQLTRLCDQDPID
jgi:hypothetical protein